MVRDDTAGNPAANKPEERKGASWRRWGLSLVVFLIVLGWIDLGNFRATLSRIRFFPLLLGFLLLILALVFLRAGRFWLLIKTQGNPLSLRDIIRVQWTAAFFSLLLPGTLGADGWRVWAVSRVDERTEAAVAAVAMDRMIGFAGQIANVLLAWAIFGGMLLRRETGGLLLDAGIFCLAALAALGLLVSARVTGALTRLPGLRGRRVRQTLARLQEGLRLLGRRPGRLPIILAVAAAGHFLNVLAVFVLARGLGVDLAFGYYMALIPPALMATGLPISFTGLGVRDLTYVSLFRPLGAPGEIMLAVSVAEFGLTVLIRLIGGLFYLFSARADAAQRKRTV